MNTAYCFSQPLQISQHVEVAIPMIGISQRDLVGGGAGWLSERNKPYIRWKTLVGDCRRLTSKIHCSFQTLHMVLVQNFSRHFSRL